MTILCLCLWLLPLFTILHLEDFVPATWAFLKVKMFVTKSFPPLSIGVALLRVDSEPCPQILGQEVTNSEKTLSGVANSR